MKGIRAAVSRARPTRPGRRALALALSAPPIMWLLGGVPGLVLGVLVGAATLVLSPAWLLRLAMVVLALVPVVVLAGGLPPPEEVTPSFVLHNPTPHALAGLGLALLVVGILRDLEHRLTGGSPGSMSPGAGPDRRPLVSVVVPTRNSRRTIERCLRSVRAQTYRPIELIVVDNHSSDGTWEAARGLADIAVGGGPERSAQRNSGTALASGEYVLWIDADMELGREVVEQAVAAARPARALGVFLPEASRGRGFWSRCRALERTCYVGESRIEAPRLVAREYLVATGGFAEWLSGLEDAELRTRMLKDDVPLARADALIVHDEGRLTLGGVARKRYYYGLGLPQYRAARPGAAAAQARATLSAYARNWRTLSRHPALAAGLVVLRAVEAGAYLAGATAGWLGGGEPRPGRTRR